MARQQTKRRRKRYQPGSAYAGDVRPAGILGVIGGAGMMKAVFFVMALALAGGGLYGVFNTGVFSNNQDNLAGFNLPPDRRPTATPSGPTVEPKQYPSAPAMIIDTSKTYTATISTALGDIQLELDAAAAPQTVNNFVFLARDGFYDGLVFHQVEPGFDVQAGDPSCLAGLEASCRGDGGPGYDLPQEGTGAFEAGTVGMANGSQFFIALSASDQFDGFTPFARVISGLDVAERLVAGTEIESVQITES